jgi:MoaA/NifB/PqqE/SkfB family radical SAM enzyme
MLRSVAPFGVNTVVNSSTIDELDDVTEFAERLGASELLLLPEQPTGATRGISQEDSARLARWIWTTRTQLRLAISRSGLEDLLPVVEVIPHEHPLDAHLHIDAMGILRPNAYSLTGIRIEGSVMEAVHALREAA